MASGNRPKNKYVAKPHLSERELRGLPRPFRADATAPSAAEPTGLSRVRPPRARREGLRPGRPRRLREDVGAGHGGKVPRGSATHADGPTSYDGLVDRGCRHRHRARRGEDESVERGDPGGRTDGIESLWGLAESRLVKYRGIAKGDFYLHLRERELRLNMRGGDMYRLLLSELSRRPLK